MGGDRSWRRRPQQIPDVVDDGHAVAVDFEIIRFVVVAGDVVAGDACRFDRAHQLVRVGAVIDVVDVEVVDVEQQIAVRRFQNRIHEFRLGELRCGWCVVGDIFDGDATAEGVLDLADTCGNVFNGFLCKRYRQQLMQPRRTVRAIAQMLAVQRDVMRVEE